MKSNKNALIALTILIACSAVYLTSVSANEVASSATVLNAAPTVDDVGLTPDDDPAPQGVQVINPDWETRNKTVTITATVTDMNGWDDLTGTVTAEITGPSPVNDSPVSLVFDHDTSVITAVYTGVFNMSDHANGDYTVTVTAADSGGLSGTGYESCTYLCPTTYDFTTGAGMDRWAFRKQHFAKPPAANDDPDDEFTADQYENIKVDDGTMQVDASAARRFYAIHRFNFSIEEPESSITKINILWDGKGEHDWGTDGATLYIWNFKTGAYEQLDNSTDDDYITLEGNITASIEDYLSPDGNLTIIAEQNSPLLKLWRWKFRSRLSTDYVKVEVTWSSLSNFFTLETTFDNSKHLNRCCT